MTIDQFTQRVLARQDCAYRWKFEDGNWGKPVDMGHAIQGIEYYVEELKRHLGDLEINKEEN